MFFGSSERRWCGLESPGRTGELVCRLPFDNNKISWIARAENTAVWKKQYSQYSRYSWNKVPCFTKPKNRRQAVISRNSGTRTKTTSRLPGEPPGDRRNSQRRHSATHTVSSRLDDRAMMTPGCAGRRELPFTSFPAQPKSARTSARRPPFALITSDTAHRRRLRRRCPSGGGGGELKRGWLHGWFSNRYRERS